MFRRTAAVGAFLLWAISLASGEDADSKAGRPQAAQGAQQSIPAGTPALGQAPGTAGPARGTTRGRTHPGIDSRVKTLARSLDLNETQQAEVKKILEQRQQEILRLRNDPSIPGDTRIDLLRAIQEKTVERIRSVLNGEQRKKYNPLAPRNVPPAPDQRTVEDWIQATTSAK